MGTGARKRLDVRTLAIVGVLSALIFALSTISIPIGDISRIHFGNIMCLLGGLLFGPGIGGISAGIGSMLYDFTNPLYTPEFWITFLTKFAMGFVAGMLSRALKDRLPTLLRYTVAGLAGSFTYLALYVLKSVIMQHYVYGNAWAVVWPLVGGKALISGINGVVAVVASVMLAPVLRAALKAAKLAPNTM